MSMPPAGEASGHFLHNLVVFGRILRVLGLDINPDRLITLVKALEHVNIANKEEFYHGMRCVVVNEKDEIPVFDRAFDLFWRKPGQRGLNFQFEDLGRPTLTQPHQKDPRTAKEPSPLSKPIETKVENQDENEDLSPLLDLTQMYSAQEILRQKDFSELDPDELIAVKNLIKELIWQLGQKQTRRYRPGRGLMIDMRRSLRRNLHYGGEILQWSYRQPKIKPRPLVVIADISGSMERYTNLLLHFTYSLAIGLEQSVESFVFSTRLTRITYQLRNKDVDAVIKDVSQTVPDWSGGTRIGDALKRFNFDWARRVSGHGAVILLISDGWDRGAPELLANEISRLQRSCHRLVWLNPLLGSLDYEPLTRGMQAALPYVDDFLPIHNLASLEELAVQLIRMEKRRPLRRQHNRGLIVS
jgi:uncharacterized protein with von Willebrand factor type A (vWA) domain